MTNVHSVVFKQLRESEEFETLQEEFRQLQSTIQGGNQLKDIYAITKSNVFAPLLKRRLTTIIETYIQEALDDFPPDTLTLSSNYNLVSVYFPFSKIPSIQYQPNCWAAPTSNLLTVDFAKQEIRLYDALEEYKQAQDILQQNIAKEKEKLADLKSCLALMDKKKHSNPFILKEIRNQILFIHKPRFFLLTVSCFFLPSKRKLLHQAMTELIQKQEKHVKHQQERIEELESRDYLQLYKEYQDIQQKILKKLESLSFSVQQVKISSIFLDDDES